MTTRGKKSGFARINSGNRFLHQPFPNFTISDRERVQFFASFDVRLSTRRAAIFPLHNSHSDFFCAAHTAGSNWPWQEICLGCSNRLVAMNFKFGAACSKSWPRWHKTRSALCGCARITLTHSLSLAGCVCAHSAHPRNALGLAACENDLRPVGHMR
jgi:hypothetical protein